MKADLDRASRDRESTVAAKQKVEDKQKEIVKAQDELNRTVHQQCKTLRSAKNGWPNS